MAEEPDLLITAGFSDAQLVAESNKVVAAFKKRGEEAQKAFQDASGRVTNTAAARAHMRELDRLSKAYDPVYRAAARYEAEVKKLDRALDLGAISQADYTARVADAAREMQSATQATSASATAMAASTARAQTSVQALGQGVAVAGGGIGRFRGQVQNAAFQFQDFVVQVQNGTAASVAFSQQAPQLLGGFGALGAVLGLVAALAVPVGAALWRMAGQSDDAAKMAEAFDKSLQSARAALTSFNATINTQSIGSMDRLIEKYGRADRAVRDLEARMRQAFRDDAFDGFESLIDENALGQLLGANSPVARVFGRVEELRRQAEAAKAQLDELAKFDATAGMSGQFGAVRLLQQQEIEAARLDMERLNAEVARFGVTPDQIATFDAARDSLNQALDEQNFTAAIAALDTIQAVLRETGDETLVGVANQLDVVSSTLAEAASEAGELPPELAAAAREAAALADYMDRAAGAVASLQGAISTLGISNVGRQARVAALQAGQSASDAAIAGRLAERRAELESTFRPDDANATGIERELSQYEQALREEARLASEISALEDKLRPEPSGNRGGAGRASGRGATDRQPFDITARTTEQISALEREISLIGMSNEEVAVARARWAALDEAKRRGIPVNAEMMAQIDAQAAQFGRLTVELERAEAAQQQFDQAINGIANAMSGALLAGESLRDGFANILRRIAADILSSGIRQALIGQFVVGGGGGGFLRFLGPLLGSRDPLTAALQGAGVTAIPSFEGGGDTGPGIRAGGVDGRGGQLAILHPNETVIDHGRGQASGANLVFAPTINLGGSATQEDIARLEAVLEKERRSFAANVLRVNAQSRARQG